MIAMFVTFSRLAKAMARGFRDAEFRALLFLLGALLVLGTIFYSQVEGWSVLNSLYFSTVTLTTVGYGDFTPVTSLGKVFTIIYLLSGVGISVATLAKLASVFLEDSRVKKRLEAKEQGLNESSGS